MLFEIKIFTEKFEEIFYLFIIVKFLISSFLEVFNFFSKMSVNIELVKRLERNDRTQLIAAISIYLKLIGNILEHPNEEKYRKFKKTNPRISKELLNIDGMSDILIDSGFEHDGDQFILRRGGIGSITKLKSYHELFKRRIDDFKELPKSLSISSTVSKSVIAENVQPKIIKPVKIVASKPFHERITFPKVVKTNNEFLGTLEHLSDSVLQYEDKLLQESALQLMPLERFKLNALEKLRKIQKLIINGEITDPEPPLDDLILEELAFWFKTEFFTWINSAPCRVCNNQNTQPMGTSSMNGLRVEKYFCDTSNCKAITEFPRYNDIQKLLVTRSGRCGEYANCFTFLCRCLNYDARFIYCTSDHVWTEVYNHTKKRWIHIDPSENVFDSPLMYEAGWKRKLEYVLAFSKDDVQDVTWRYSCNHEELMKRRKMCTGKEMNRVLMELRMKRQSNVSKARKKFLDLRTLAELAELMIQKEPTEDELRGRTSGSLKWRLERGETSLLNCYIFQLNEDEKKSKSFNLRYSCSKNLFQRVVNSEVIETSNDFTSWCYNFENIFRKVEYDHGMVYLARTEDSTQGNFQLKFDFGDMKIQSIDLNLDMTTFHSGKTEMKILDEFDKSIGKEELKGRSKFSIKVNVSGGDGDSAWQHAQIFRQQSKSNDFPFKLSVNF